MSAITISAESLSKRFSREWIFRKLTITFTPENIYVITGSNGSGKSTLLQVLSGHIPPSGGTLRFTKAGEHLSEDEVFKHISLAAPYMDLIDEFTLTEQLNFHFRMKKIREGVTVEDLISILYLENARDKLISNFSSGMKQRLKLGIAFYTQAAVLFLDEPGTNLDKRAFSWYLNELLKVPKNGVIIIASNNALEYPENAAILNIEEFKR